MKDFTTEFEDKNVLITGGAGFIGSNLAHELVKLKANVEVFDCLLPSQGGNIYNLDGITNKIKLKIADVRDKNAVVESVKNKDLIFNLASQTGHMGSVLDPLTDLDINCRGSLTLLEACKKHNPNVKIIYSGTRGQYGKIIYNPVDEKHPTNPTDPNGVSKLSAEKYHILFYNIHGVKTTSLRLTNTYGQRQQMKDPDLGFVNWFIRLAMDNKEIKIFGDGKIKRDLNHVDDVVRALLMVSLSKKSNGEIFNLGCGTPISIIDLTKLIIKKVGSGSFKLTPYPKERGKIEIGGYVADISKIKKMVGWLPKTPLEEGLEKTIEFYRKNKPKYW